MEIGKAREIIRGIHDDDVEVEGKNISEGKKMDKNRVGYLTAEEKEREDQEQIEYLRKWKEKREKKREHRRKVKLYDRLFAGRKRRNTLSVPECRIREKMLSTENGCRRRFTVEKIICIPTKSDKLRISVRITGEMVKDFCDCLRKAYTMSGKDCDTCSWGDLTIGDVGMCEMDEVRKAVGKWEVPDE